MTTSRPKPTQDAQGNLTVTLDKPYSFRSPKGKDLATIQRSIKEDQVDIELMANILSCLSLDELSFDSVMDLDAEVLVELGGAVMSTFRVFSKKAV